MNTRINTVVKTLVITDHSSEGDQLINLLRQAGLSILAEEVKDEAWLVQNLPRKQWDLLLILANCDRIDPQQALAQVQRMDIDIACIIVCEEKSATATRLLIEAGAKALIQRDDKFDFVHSTQRELAYLEERRESRRNAVALRELQKRHQLLLDSASNAIAYIHEGMHIYANKAYIELFALKNIDELISTPFMDLVAGTEREKVKDFLRSELRGVNSHLVFSVVVNDRPLQVSMDCTEVSYEGEESLQVVLEPIKGSREHSESHSKSQNSDLLTGLMNEKSLFEGIEKAISSAVNYHIHSSLIIVKLQHFNEVSTVLGKSNSNLLLADCGRFLQSICPSDTSIYRMDDSEFAILLGQMSPTDVKDMVQRISAEVERSLLDSVPPTLELNCLTGVTAITERSPNAEIIITRAKHDLLSSSIRPVSTQNINEPDERSHAENDQSDPTLSLINDAFSKEKFVLAFQPIVSLKEDGLEHYEVRIRIREGDNTVYPPQFLDSIHQNGLGEKLDRLVISQALICLQEQGNQKIRFTINLTHNSITSESLLPWLNDNLQKRRISTEYLVLQISEIDVMSSHQYVINFCKRLDELNIKLSITHFGCTLHPYQYLAELPAYFIKLDKSLLDDLDVDGEQQERLDATVSGLHAKGLRVIAPMVDKMRILPLLWQAEVNFVQGNCLQEPSERMDFSFVEDEEITLASF